MASQIKLRRGTAAQWTSANPILAEGEAGFEIDTNQLKIGNGTDNWATLDYISADLTPYLTIASASSTYATLNDPIFTDDVDIIGDLKVDGQINLLMSGSTSLANINGFQGMGTELYITSNDNFLIQAVNGYGSVFAQDSLVLSCQNGNLLLEGANGEFLNTTASANQIATVGNLELYEKRGNITSIITSSSSSAPYVVQENDKYIRFSVSQGYVTLPNAANYTGREIHIINMLYGGGAISTSSNIRKLDNTISDTIYTFEPGKSGVILVSDGSYWSVMFRM